MKAGTAFALAASQPSASEVRFALREAINIAASCRVSLAGQVQFLPRKGAFQTAPVSCGSNAASLMPIAMGGLESAPP